MSEEKIQNIKEVLYEWSKQIVLADPDKVALRNGANAINQLQQENKRLKKQLDYLISGEYHNQLKFERNMLENIVQNVEVSKEDKKFIDMTHRNTELLEENNLYKSVIDEIEKIIKGCKALFPHEYDWGEQTDLILTKIANIKESE